MNEHITLSAIPREVQQPHENDVLLLSFQAGLVLFSIVFIGLVLVAATFSTAESARLADEGVLHSIHQQVWRVPL